MAIGVIINTALALLWLFLGGGGLSEFIKGFLAGFLILALFPDLVGSRDYVRRTRAFIQYGGIFTKEFILANWTITKAVLLRKSEDIHPDFITYDVAGLSALEIYLLAQSITLTPGTTTVDLMDGGKTLLIHAFDGDQPESVRSSIDNSLRRGILAFTR